MILASQNKARCRHLLAATWQPRCLALQKLDQRGRAAEKVPPMRAPGLQNRGNPGGIPIGRADGDDGDGMSAQHQN